jgi:DnaJ domain
LWAAWWTAPHTRDPFRKPDASSGGARTREEARAQAERAAGRALVEIDGRWAGACVRIARGEDPWPKPRADRAQGEAPRVAPSPAGSKAWARALLGVAPGAGQDEIKRAFRALALRTHPDRGGEEGAFIDAKRALDVALATPEARRRRRR